MRQAPGAGQFAVSHVPHCSRCWSRYEVISARHAEQLARADQALDHRLRRTRGWAKPSRTRPMFDAISEALERGVIGFDAVKHLVLCRIEKRPPRLNLLAHPYLPRAEVATTSARSYMGLLKGAAPAIRHSLAGPSSEGPQAADLPTGIRQAMRCRGRRSCAPSWS